MVKMKQSFQFRNQANKGESTATYRYDLFKGFAGPDGKITKVRSVGSARIREGQSTFLITLKTFLNDRFYLLPDHRPESPNNYVILTREISRSFDKKYFWNTVGEARILTEPNQGLMKLSWDILSGDLYMAMLPLQFMTDVTDTQLMAA